MVSRYGLPILRVYGKYYIETTLGKNGTVRICPEDTFSPGTASLCSSRLHVYN